MISFGITGLFGYDGLHRPTSDAFASAGGATVASVGYEYDADGNLTSKTTTGFAGPRPAPTATARRKWPDTDEVLDDSPWAAAPLIREASGPFMHFAMSYSRANEAAPFAAEAAAQLGLVCFNPQQGCLWR